jgi:hypothetical protein
MSVGVILERTDLSLYQIEMLTSSLLNSFDPNYMLSFQTVTQCVGALHDIAALLTMRFGLLVSATTIQNLVDVLSSAYSIPNIDSSSRSLITQALAFINDYMQYAVVDGEFPFEIVTDNVRLSVRANLISSIGNSTYHAPSSSSDGLLDVASPSLAFAPEGLSRCADYLHYARVFVSVVKDHVKFDSDTVTAASPFFQIGSALTGESSGTLWSGSNFVNYTLVIPLTSARDLNWTTSQPDCQYFDPVTSQFVPCPCTISALTTTNMTLQCSDSSGLFCRRHAKGWVTSDTIRRSLRSQRGKRGMRMPRREHTRRRLDFDYSGSEKDSYDGDTRLGNYLPLVKALDKEFVNVTTSPSNWRTAWPLLIGIFVVLLLFIIGLIYFSIWDETDRLYTIYEQGKGGGPAELFGVQTKAQMGQHMTAFISREYDDANGKGLAAVDGRGEWMPREPLTVKRSNSMISDSIPSVSSLRALGAIQKGMSLRRQMSTESEFELSAPMSPSNSMKKMASFVMGEEIKKFFGNVIPASDLISKHSFLERFYGAILGSHDWIRVFTFRSLRLTRVLRYVKICVDLLLIIFVDCLFYGELNHCYCVYV